MNRFRVFLVAVLMGGLLLPASAWAAGGDDANKAWADAYGQGVEALQAKRFDAAETHLIKAFEVASAFDGKDLRHRNTLEALVKLWMKQRQWAAAQTWLEKIVAADEFRHGPDHLEVSYSLERLARNLLMLKRYDEAEAGFQRALEIVGKHRGPLSPDAAKVRHNLAETYRRAGHLDKAVSLYQSALAQKEEKLGKDHPDLASTLNDLGLVFNQLKKLDQALPLLERAVKLRTPKGEADGVLGRCQHNLADTFAGLTQFDRALSLYQAAIRSAEAQQPPDNPGLANSLNNLGNLYQQTNKLPDAERAYRRAIALRIEEFGGRHRSVKRAKNNLAKLLEAMGKSGEAAALKAEIGRQ